MMPGFIAPFVSPKAAAIALLATLFGGLLSFLPIPFLGESVLYYVALFVAFYFAALVVVRLSFLKGKLGPALVGLLGAVFFGAFLNFGLRFSGQIIGYGTTAFPSLAMGLLHFLVGYVSASLVFKFYPA